MTVWRILHLIPSLGGGGAERQLTMLAIEQVRRGWDVHVGLRRGGHYLQALHDGGVTVHMMGDYRGLDPRLPLSIVRLLVRVRPSVMQTWLPQMDIAGGLAALWRSVKWVACERASELAYRDRPGYYRLRQFFVRHADAVVANSGLGMAYWRPRLPASVPAFRVGNVVDVAAIRDAMSQTSAETLGEGDHIISVGRMTYQKAPEILLAAVGHLAHFPSLRIHFFGEGDMQAQVEATVKSANLQDKVAFHSYRPDWWSLLPQVRALVSASRFEGQPNVVLEAMAAGCPLVVTGIPEHCEVLDASAALIVPVDNPEALANAIASVLSDPEAARQRAARASARVEGMSAAAAAQAYEDIYHAVMDRAA